MTTQQQWENIEVHERSIINEEPNEDEESSATFESGSSPLREGALTDMSVLKNRILVELITEDSASPAKREGIKGKWGMNAIGEEEEEEELNNC
jgi:hypothetical protein